MIHNGIQSAPFETNVTAPQSTKQVNNTGDCRDNFPLASFPWWVTQLTKHLFDNAQRHNIIQAIVTICWAAAFHSFRLNIKATMLGSSHVQPLTKRSLSRTNTLAVLSKDPDASLLPSQLHATECTLAECAGISLLLLLFLKLSCISW